MQLTPTQKQALERLMQAFLEENSKLNLSAFRTSEQCWVGNILDSLALYDMLPTLLPGFTRQSVLSILDIGIGGGFPLLPLSIILPHVQFIGLDATLKKVDAVDRIIRLLKLANVKVLSGRAEEVGHTERMRGQFDIVMSRAVAPINTLLEYCVPFAKTNGNCVLWKSMHVAEELRQSAVAAKALHVTLAQSFAYTLPSDWGERQLLAFRKTKSTDAQYPRKTGLPKSKPL